MSQKHYSQKGGAIRLPNRFYNPDAKPFDPCCPVHGNKQQGGGIRMPYRYFHPDAKPFTPCAGGCHSQSGGGCPCGCENGCHCDSGCTNCKCDPTGHDPYAIYYNDFRRHEGMHAYNSSNMTGGSYRQRGGNPTAAPLHVFTEGEPLKYNFSMNENFSGGPVFDTVRPTKFW